MKKVDEGTVDEGTSGQKNTISRLNKILAGFWVFSAVGLFFISQIGQVEENALSEIKEISKQPIGVILDLILDAVNELNTKGFIGVIKGILAALLAVSSIEIIKNIYGLNSIQSINKALKDSQDIIEKSYESGVTSSTADKPKLKDMEGEYYRFYVTFNGDNKWVWRKKKVSLALGGANKLISHLNYDGLEKRDYTLQAAFTRSQFILILQPAATLHEMPTVEVYPSAANNPKATQAGYSIRESITKKFLFAPCLLVPIADMKDLSLETKDSDADLSQLSDNDAEAINSHWKKLHNTLPISPDQGWIYPNMKV